MCFYWETQCVLFSGINLAQKKYPQFWTEKLFSVQKKYVIPEKKFSEDRKSVTPKPDAFTYECTGNFSAN